jgi:hypothetical protein
MYSVAQNDSGSERRNRTILIGRVLPNAVLANRVKSPVWRSRNAKRSETDFSSELEVYKYYVIIIT